MAGKSDFSNFYQLNIDRIYRYVYFRVGKNKELTEDLVSEIFLKALKHFEKYDENRSKSAWLYTISRNHLANHFRDKKETIDIDEIAYSLTGIDGNKVIEKNEVILEVEKALATLSTKDCRLVTLKHLEGYSYLEMAEILNKSPESLKVATHRAVKKLKKHMAKYK
jgi:RNA polymerase sigma-70 factor (ECF subfamily)